MKATFRIVTPAAASAAVAALLLTGCADKPVRVPGGTFVEEPIPAGASTRTETIPGKGANEPETEIIYIETDVPVGPVEGEGKAGQGGASAQQGGAQIQPVEQESAAKSNVPEGSVEYKVVKGDTLWGIGMVYGVSVARLAEINGLDAKAPLKVGQILMIPPDAKNAVNKPIPQKKDTKTETNAKPATTTKPASTAKPASTTKAQPVAKDGETLYVVTSGDKLSMIAYRHHVKLADLVAANKIDPKATLRIGQTLVIPAAGSTASAAKTASTTETKTTTDSGTKSSTASTKPASTSATTTPAAGTASQPKAGEGTGGIVEPIGGSIGGASASTPATTTTAKPASGSSALALDPVSGLSDADVISVQIDSESTIEEVANIHDRNLEDLIRLNPEFKPGQKIPAGTAVKMPLF